MTINRALSYQRQVALSGVPLCSIKWDPTFRIFYPPGTNYAEATRDLASRFSAWVWVSPVEVEVAS
jgi:hypothetical protein